MATAVDQRTEAGTLEEEFKDLVREERELEQRTDQLSITGGLTLVFSIFGLILGVTALTIALIANGKAGDNGSAAAPSRAGASMPGSAGMAGSAGMPGGSPAGASATKPGTVNVSLGEMWVRPNVASAPAGKITFAARNLGQVRHELMVERIPIKMEAPGKPNERAAVGMIQDLDPGQTGKMTLRLKPGRYELFCNVPGHYAAGQQTTFTVTRS